jgi:hypothetical protein
MARLAVILPGDRGPHFTYWAARALAFTRATEE